jgi:MFS family permease
MVRVGYRRLAVVGATVVIVGSVVLFTTSSRFGFAAIAVSAGVLGFGLGLFSAPLLIVIQSTVSWNKRGAATALNQLARTIGGAIGVSAMGVLVQAFVANARPADVRGALEAGMIAAFGSLVLIGLAIFIAAVLVARTPGQLSGERAPALG